MSLDVEYPCPSCNEVFISLDDLYSHALEFHNEQSLINLLEGHFMSKKQLTKSDFIQVDSSWVCVVDGFQLTLGRNANGEFRLQVVGTFEPIPPATQYPTEPEWDLCLELSNKFKTVHDVSKEKFGG